VPEGRKIRCEQELRYPGYIILAFDLSLNEHGPAKRTAGIDYLLPKGADPVPLPDEWVPEMRAYELRSYIRAKARSKPVTRKDIHRHDKVTIDLADHAAFGKEGEVMETSKYRAKVIVGLSVFNIPLIHLRKVEEEKEAA
jgi:transcription antitermination factor NusG